MFERYLIDGSDYRKINIIVSKELELILTAYCHNTYRQLNMEFRYKTRTMLQNIFYFASHTILNLSVCQLKASTVSFG